MMIAVYKNYRRKCHRWKLIRNFFWQFWGISPNPSATNKRLSGRGTVKRSRGEFQSYLKSFLIKTDIYNAFETGQLTALSRRRDNRDLRVEPVAKIFSHVVGNYLKYFILIIILILTFKKFNNFVWTEDNCRFSRSSNPLLSASESSDGSMAAAAAAAWSSEAAAATCCCRCSDGNAVVDKAHSRQTATMAANDEESVHIADLKIRNFGAKKIVF